MTDNNYEGLAKIAAKKAAIMAELATFAKDRRNESQKYGYASAETIFNTIREKMAAHSLVIFPSVVEHKQDEFKSAKGTPGLHTVVTYRMAWVCTETGAVWEDFWVGEGDDYQDKGYSKTATLALKYFLLTTFVVSSGDHADDADSGLDAKPTQAKAKAQSTLSDTPVYNQGDSVWLNLTDCRRKTDVNGKAYMVFKIGTGLNTAPVYSSDLFKRAGYAPDGFTKEWTVGTPIWAQVRLEGKFWTVTALAAADGSGTVIAEEAKAS